MDVDATTDELYGLRPSEFTETRDARIAEANAEGDREAAAALKRLRRPSSGAWLANQVVRRHPESVDHLLGIGAALRDAQAKLDGGEMRRLSAEGREVVASVVKLASELSRDLGEVVSETARKDLESTLDAALADPESANALRTGRLTGALQYSGLGLADAMAQSGRASSTRNGSQETDAGRSRELERASEELERVRDQLREAETAVSAAEATLAQRKDVAARAAGRVEEAEKAVRALQNRSSPRKSRGR